MSRLVTSIARKAARRTEVRAFAHRDRENVGAETTVVVGRGVLRFVAPEFEERDGSAADGPRFCATGGASTEPPGGAAAAAPNRERLPVAAEVPWCRGLTTNRTDEKAVRRDASDLRIAERLAERVALLRDLVAVATQRLELGLH